ncbi:MAG: GntR family transcriptional regulator [Emcibacteraceae bacterium]|nr:GntR family transcriptional regulator [Emcibacteraceae bacterium]
MAEPVSASEFAASYIRDAILRNELKPNSRIQQHALAAELGVSHVPLREAIQMLVAEGFLTTPARRGAFVTPLSEEHVREIFNLRIVLELDMLKNSIPNLTPEQLSGLNDICDGENEVSDIIQYGDFNAKFHLALYGGATRPRQIFLIKSLWNNALRYSTLLRIDGNHFTQSQAEHRAMVDYACKGDIDGACGILEEHLSFALNRIVSIMQENHDVE